MGGVACCGSAKPQETPSLKFDGSSPIRTPREDHHPGVECGNVLAATAKKNEPDIGTVASNDGKEAAELLRKDQTPPEVFEAVAADDHEHNEAITDDNAVLLSAEGIVAPAESKEDMPYDAAAKLSEEVATTKLNEEVVEAPAEAKEDIPQVATTKLSEEVVEGTAETKDDIPQVATTKSSEEVVEVPAEAKEDMPQVATSTLSEEVNEAPAETKEEDMPEVATAKLSEEVVEVPAASKEDEIEADKNAKPIEHVAETQAAANE